MQNSGNSLFLRQMYDGCYTFLMAFFKGGIFSFGSSNVYKHRGASKRLFDLTFTCVYTHRQEHTCTHTHFGIKCFENLSDVNHQETTCFSNLKHLHVWSLAVYRSMVFLRQLIVCSIINICFHIFLCSYILK